MGEGVKDINPTCGAEAKLLGGQNPTENSILPARTGDIPKQNTKGTLANSVFKLLHRGESTLPVVVSWFERKESRSYPQQPGSTSTLEVRQEGNLRWTQGRSAFLKKHKSGKNDSTKSYEILSRKAARLHMDPCRARHERHS